MAGSALPDGRVTFLFTDIEGSTRLIEKLGEDRYVEALAEHRRLIREAFSSRGGVEVDTQGDAFFFAFVEAGDALRAAAAGQAALAAGPVRVRMGVHTAEARPTGEGYAGRELHRAARIAASGHGGQVVVSAATRALVDGEVTELGEHRLKDFDEPVALFQLGTAHFPPLKTVSNTNLPRPVSSFVGRQRERAELVALLSNETRLVTLSGPGGSGKTRLAVEVATELVPQFKAGVFWIGLSALREPALVAGTVAQTLGAKDGLVDHVGERELLLLLDNFEQVVEAAPELGALLESCPNLRCLVTSRELLRIDGEIDYPVPPLAESEAVELFCARSRLDPDEAIAELCRRLDELPLAIELAAARTSVLSVAQILERLSEQLDLLKGGRDVEARQQTLRATIEWSHDLLDEDEQRLFARLSVFRGGCTLVAAEQVTEADLDTLQSLVDKSLLRHTSERFWMLEAIREYARECLTASGEEADVRGRQAVFVLGVVATALREMEGGGDQASRVETVAAEFDNVRAALEWADDAGEDDLLARLVAAIHRFWAGRGLYEEVDKWLARALERPQTPAATRMALLRGAAARAMDSRRFEWADELIGECRLLAEHSGDEAEMLNVLQSAGNNANERGDFTDARAKFVALRDRARELGDLDKVAIATVNLSVVALRSGEFEAGLAAASEAAAQFRELGDDGGVAVASNNYAVCALQLSDPSRAEESWCEALAIGGRLGWKRFIASVALGLAAALIAQHQEERGVQLLGAGMSLRDELGVGWDDELDEVVYAKAVAHATAALGEDGFAAARARGEGMTPEEIVAFTMPA